MTINLNIHEGAKRGLKALNEKKLSAQRQKDHLSHHARCQYVDGFGRNCAIGAMLTPQAKNSKVLLNTDGNNGKNIEALVRGNVIKLHPSNLLVHLMNLQDVHDIWLKHLKVLPEYYDFPWGDNKKSYEDNIRAGYEYLIEATGK